MHLNLEFIHDYYEFVLMFFQMMVKCSWVLGLAIHLVHAATKVRLCRSLH